MSINEDELRRLAEAARMAEIRIGAFNEGDTFRHLETIDLYRQGANPAAVLALLDTIAALRQELRTVIDESNALVQRQRQELDAANQRAKAAETKTTVLRTALQRLRNASDEDACEYGRTADGRCAGDGLIVGECVWCEADRVLAS